MYLCPPPYFTQRCPKVLSRPINRWARVWRKSRLKFRIENIEHCFLACPRVVRVWNYFSALLSCLSDSTFVVSIPSVFYPMSDDQLSLLSSLFNYFVATILYWVWLARNSATFRNCPKFTTNKRFN